MNKFLTEKAVKQLSEKKIGSLELSPVVGSFKFVNCEEPLQAQNNFLPFLRSKLVRIRNKGILKVKPVFCFRYIFLISDNVFITDYLIYILTV
jgi:hypothetical protein